MSSPSAIADSSSRDLASYYERHMALAGGVAYPWVGRGAPQRARSGVLQVGVGRYAWFALLLDGTLVTRAHLPGTAAAHDVAVTLMRGVASLAAGHCGWFAIDRAGGLWYAAGLGAEPRQVAQDVMAACIGDSADYYITRGRTLFAKGLAQRGQCGDVRLLETATFVATAADAVAVKAHTGYAIHLRLMGTGGNRFGPLSAHGLGEKADRWGLVFEGAVAIATGARHSAAIRADGSLRGWGRASRSSPRS